jgi:hypothetical protein
LPRKGSFSHALAVPPSEKTLALIDPSPLYINNNIIEKEIKKIKRYTNVDFPDYCIVGQPSILNIQLLIEVEINSKIKKLIEIPISDIEKNINLRIIITAPDFHVDKNQKTMNVPIDKNSENVIFTLYPKTSGKHTIELEIFFRAARIGYIILETIANEAPNFDLLVV